MAKSDPAAERAVLGGIFQHGNDAYLDLCDLITPATFTIDSNEVLYRCLGYLLREDPQARPDLPSVLSTAKTLGLHKHLEKKEEMLHLRGIMNLGQHTELPTVRKLAGKIRKLEIARLMDAQLERVQVDLDQISGDEPIREILGLVENPLFDLTSLLSKTQTDGVKPMGEGALDYIQYLMNNPRYMVGVSTGLAAFDESIGGGLREECLDIIAARQKTGKTILGDNIGLFIAQQTVPVLNVDTEMSREQHQLRILANLSGLDVREIEKGQYAFQAENRHKLEEAARRLHDLPYDYLCARDLSFEDTLAHVRRWLYRKVGLDDNGRAKPCVIIYDWLKLASTGDINKNMAEYQLLGYVTSSLKNFMGRYGARCLCFAQLNREGIDTEDTSVIRGSDRILDFCTSFSLYKLQNDDEVSVQDGEQEYTHKLINLISRFGPAMRKGEYINIRSIYEQGKIVEGPMVKLARKRLEPKKDKSDELGKINF